jgi:hypothetical protein
VQKHATSITTEWLSPSYLYVVAQFAGSLFKVGLASRFRGVHRPKHRLIFFQTSYHQYQNKFQLFCSSRLCTWLYDDTEMKDLPEGLPWPLVPATDAHLFAEQHYK